LFFYLNQRADKEQNLGPLLDHALQECPKITQTLGFRYP